MKCVDGNEASAICINCGRALCESCMKLTDSGKHICSSKCGDEVGLNEHLLRLMYSRATYSAKVSAYGIYVLAIIFLSFSTFEWLRENSVISSFLSLVGIGMAIMGVLIHISSKSDKLFSVESTTTPKIGGLNIEALKGS